MKRLFAAMTAALMMVALVSSTAFAAAGGNAGGNSSTLKCFTGGAATCTIAAGGTVTLANITVDYTDYAGVYINSKSTSNKLIGTVSFSFNYDPTAYSSGNPRFSIPINDGLGTPGLYAFLDGPYCGNTGVVDTALATCAVYLNTGQWFANWAAFVAADPTYRVSSGGIPFIVADWPSSTSNPTYTIWGIVLR